MSYGRGKFLKFHIIIFSWTLAVQSSVWLSPYFCVVVKKSVHSQDFSKNNIFTFQTRGIKLIWESLTLSKTSSFVDLNGAFVPQHPTHHVSILLIPHIITHCPPAAFMENLHTSFMRTWPVHQPHQGLLHCKTRTSGHVSRICEHVWMKKGNYEYIYVFTDWVFMLIPKDLMQKTDSSKWNHKNVGSLLWRSRQILLFMPTLWSWKKVVFIVIIYVNDYNV